MQHCADGVLVAQPLIPVEGGGSIPTSALQLSFDRIEKKRCKALIGVWHRTQPRIGAFNTMKECFGASFDGTIFAVACWSNPVARCLDQKTVMELRRFAIGPDSPKNTASRMLAWMSRTIFKDYQTVDRLISYQDEETHAGTIYKASGWNPISCSVGGAWSNRKRFNRTAKRAPFKTRWEKLRVGG